MRSVCGEDKKEDGGERMKLMIKAKMNHRLPAVREEDLAQSLAHRLGIEYEDIELSYEEEKE